MPDQQGGTATRPERRLPDHVTMPLLTLITQQSLDEDYRHVAERRAREGRTPAAEPKPWRSHRGAAVAVAVCGLLLATAAIQTSRDADVKDASRTSLISQINDGRARVSDLQDRIARMRQTDVALETQLDSVTANAQSAIARMRRLEVRGGYVPVTGPGVRVVVDDNPTGDVTQMVRDTDLRKLVNGLWAAGAEAVSINGYRLTSLSAIRNVGVAVHVNGQGLSTPYTVLAIGDTRTLQAKLANSTTGAEFLSLKDQLGFEFSMDDVGSLSLPEAKLPHLRTVQAGTAADVQSQNRNEGNTP